MKLLQLNAWGGRLDRQITAFIKQEQPDIICLQEALSVGHEDPFLFLSIENMQQLAELPYAVMGPVFSFNYMHSTAQFGNAILSRLPIQKSEIIFTYMAHQPNFKPETGSYNVRNFVHAVITLGDTPYNVITHHGFHIPDHKNGSEETLRQMAILADYIVGLEGPVILTGDFNLAPHSPSLELLNQKLSNLSVSHKLKTTRNNLTHKTEVCDYIFINDQVRASNFICKDEVISDHKALILEFTP